MSFSQQVRPICQYIPLVVKVGLCIPDIGNNFPQILDFYASNQVAKAIWVLEAEA